MKNYAERFNDIAILQLDTQGFEALSEQQKKLAFYLSKAGLYGRFISLDQGSEHNFHLVHGLVRLYEQVDKNDPLHQQVHDSLFIVFAHNGIYHSTSGEKLTIPLTLEALNAYEKTLPDLVDTVKHIWFETEIPQFRTVQTDGVDVVKMSGGNFYQNLTQQEVVEFRQFNYPKVEGDEVPPFGFNEQLHKDDDGVITRGIISENGLYGAYVKQIIENLTKAVEFAENDEQALSITTLIDFYKTGSAFDFDKHCVAWTKDKDSDIYFINGLIESYEDPLGIGCTFESIVAFKNPLQTLKVNKIIDHIQWFEDNLPFDKMYKKDKALGLSASSINVISMAGDTSPSLPLGINLPNSDWIRKKHGSKSVGLNNVGSSRSSFEVAIREALFLEKYHPALENYLNMTNTLHTDLHEIAGHGSGKILDGVNTEVLGAYYSVIEETRADLVALYYMADEKLKEFGVYDNDVHVKDAALAQYVGYITNGAMGQLRRVELGNDLTQAHFRNRQLIATWVLEHADSSKVRMTQTDGKYYIEIDDVDYVKSMFGQLLEKVQTIKSTGDLDGARELVMKYGTKVDPQIHSQILERIETLDMPKVVGFITPMMVEKDNTIVLEQSNNFFEQQLKLHHEYVMQPLTNRLKIKI
jgi:dipeptidyl-peptidase-3